MIVFKIFISTFSHYRPFTMAPLSILITFALPLLATAALTPKEAQSKLQTIINSQTKAEIPELEPLWSALPPITVAKALGKLPLSPISTTATTKPAYTHNLPYILTRNLGTYKGGLFTGPPPIVNGTVPKASRDPINWWGKQIISDFSVNPLLANGPSDTTPDGRDTNIIFPYPRKDIAQARNVEHEGVVSAAIIYAK